MRQENCQAHAQQTEQAQQAAERPTLFVSGTASVQVAPITGFEGLMTTAGKVANLTDASAVDQLLAINCSTGAISASMHSTTESEDSDNLLVNGIAATLSSLFQLAAVEGVPLDMILEATRINLEKEAQDAAKTGVQAFFQERGLSSLI